MRGLFGPLLASAIVSAAAFASPASSGAAAAQSVPALPAPAAADSARIVFPASVSQGAMVIGKVPPGSQVQYAGRTLRVTGYGSVVFGVGRDATGPLQVSVRRPDGASETASIAVTARDWPVERVNGVPPKTVSPPPEIAERIRREQEQVIKARDRDDARADFAQAFACFATPSSSAAVMPVGSSSRLDINRA